MEQSIQCKCSGTSYSSTPHAVHGTLVGLLLGNSAWKGGGRGVAKALLNRDLVQSTRGFQTSAVECDCLKTNPWPYVERERVLFCKVLHVQAHIRNVTSARRNAPPPPPPHTHTHTNTHCS